MVHFKRFTSLDYIHMGKSNVWELKKLAEMLTWFALSERAQLEEFDEFKVWESMDEKIEAGEGEEGPVNSPACLAFCQILGKVHQQMEDAIKRRYIKQIQRLRLKDIEDDIVVDEEYCFTQQAAFEYFEVALRDVDLDKLKKLLAGEEILGKADAVIGNIVRAYGEEGDPSAAPKTMSEVRHSKEKHFKEGLHTRIQDYFSGDCRCTSKTAFEEIKKRWKDEADMKADVKVGFYYLNEHIKAVLKKMEEKDSGMVVRRNQAKGYSKDKILSNCPKHKRTILK